MILGRLSGLESAGPSVPASRSLPVSQPLNQPLSQPSGQLEQLSQRFELDVKDADYLPLLLSAHVLGGGGLLIWAGAQFLASQRPVDEQDSREVRDTVLVARVGTEPEGLDAHPTHSDVAVAGGHGLDPTTVEHSPGREGRHRCAQRTAGCRPAGHRRRGVRGRS